jgi:Arm DNA-binding domain
MVHETPSPFRIAERVVPRDGIEPSIGFGFRVRASGHRSWFIQYRNEAGTTRRYTLGDYGTLTPEEARQEARQQLAAAAKGGDPTSPSSSRAA